MGAQNLQHNVLYWEFVGQFWHMREFLFITSRKMFSQNPAKYVFGQEELEFIKFNLRKDRFAPIMLTIKAMNSFF